jgi:hypothetical protein
LTLLSGTVFRLNRASSSVSEALGGALSASFESLVNAAEAPQFVANSAEGADAKGGAFFLSATSDALPPSLVVSALFDSNLVRVRQGYGQGGAVHVHTGGRLNIARSFVTRNVVRMQSTAFDGTGGGVSVAAGGSVQLVDTQLWSNNAGGTGLLELMGDIYMKQSEMYRAARAVHIVSLGTVILERCSLFSDESTHIMTLENEATSWIAGLQSGTILILNSSMSSFTENQCLFVLDMLAEALIRGSVGSNVDINPGRARGRLGIVHSTFKPFLSSSLLSYSNIVGPPHCGALISGESLCDPRAQCQRRESGGVECSCSGLRKKVDDGSEDDGSACFRPTSVTASLQSATMKIDVKKPGASDTLLFNIVADGEEQFDGIYYVQISVHRLAGHSETSATYEAQDATISFGGVQLEWIDGSNPAEGTTILLDANTTSYSVSTPRMFTIKVNCSTPHVECPADGDVVTTSLTFRSKSNPEVRSESVVNVSVLAVPSCARSIVRLPTNQTILPHDAAYLDCEFYALDVDGHPINVTKFQINGALHPELSSANGIRPYFFKEAGLPFFFKHQDSSNRYEAVGMRFSARSGPYSAPPGQYRLIVELPSGWNGTGMSSCTIMDRLFTVACSRGFEPCGGQCCSMSTDALKYGIMGVVMGAVLFSFFCLLAYHVRKHKERVLQFLDSFLNHEGMLMIRVTWKGCDIAGNLFAYHTAYSVRQFGNEDLFIAFSIFIIPSLFFSINSIIIKGKLLRRRYLERRSSRMRLQHVKRHVTELRQKMKLALHMMAARYVFQHDMQSYEERKAANDAMRNQVHAEMLSIFSEGVPYFVIHAIFLLRLAHDPRNGPASSSTNVNYSLLFLIRLFSLALLVSNCIRLREFPLLRAVHFELIAEKAKLDERARTLCEALDDMRDRQDESETEDEDLPPESRSSQDRDSDQAATLNITSPPSSTEVLLAYNHVSDRVMIQLGRVPLPLAGHCDHVGEPAHCVVYS